MTANANEWLNPFWAGVVDIMDEPSLLDPSVTPIPGSGSAPLQVVASLKAAVDTVVFTDGVGRYVGLYVGPVGQEQFVCLISGGGLNWVAQAIAQGSRISLRNMETDVISKGSIFLQFALRGRSR